MSKFFSNQFTRVVSVDVSSVMIDQARENLSDRTNIDFHVGNGRDLDFCEDASIDFVFSYITLQHIPDVRIVENYIREAGRVLKPGAYCYFQVNNMHHSLRSRLQLGTRLRRIVRAMRGNADADARAQVNGPTDLDNPAWQGSRMTVTQAQQTCERARLKILSITGEGTQYMWIKAVSQK